jgi:predicted DNA binding CopG/RHH family protein
MAEFMEKQFDFIDEEEKELMEPLLKDIDKYVSGLTPEKKALYKKAAENTMKKLKKAEKISLLISHDDLEAIKKRAEFYGIPFKIMINSIIHRYNNGGLIDRISEKKIGKKTRV